MSKSRSIIVFIAVIVLFHVINAEPKAFSTGFLSARDSLNESVHTMESTVIKRVEEGIKFADGIYTGVATISYGSGSVTPIEAGSTESEQPEALALESDDNTEEPSISTAVPTTEEPSD